MRAIFRLVQTLDGTALQVGEVDPPPPNVVLITFDVPVSRLIDGIPELRELVSTLTRERDEARAEVDRLDAQAAAARRALDAAGIPDVVQHEEPEGGWPSEYERSLHAGGRALDLSERIATLAAERDEARYQLARSHQSEKCTLDPQTCKEAECFACGVLMCPHAEPMHLHHDGCPACHGAALAKARGEG